MIKQALGTELNADINLDFMPTGLVCTVTAPLPRTRDGSMSPVAGKRILVLEDDVLLALEAANTLKQIGAIVIGPAHRIDAALLLLDTEQPDAALLDVNIIGSTSAEVAERLVEDNVPFVLATGYGQHSDVTGSYAVMDKPYSREQLQATFVRLFNEALRRRP